MSGSQCRAHSGIASSYEIPLMEEYCCKYGHKGACWLTCAEMLSGSCFICDITHMFPHPFRARTTDDERILYVPFKP